MNEISKAFLYRYLNNASPVGFESSGQKIWLDYLKPHIDDYFVDTYGSVVGIINPKADYKVVIEAHADEISWFVNYISPEGYIYVIRNGGSDFAIAPSKRVNLHTDKGIVKGIFGWPAIHTRIEEKEDTKPSQKNVCIDCGCASKEEVESLGIHVGTVITFEDELMFLNEKYWVGRALDNRAGGFVIAEVVRRIRENNITLPFGLYIVNAVQEEVGLNGAAMIAKRLNPNVALCIDVCHETKSPMYDKIKHGDIACGKGVALTYAPPVQNNLLKMLFEVADNKKIPYQRLASSRTTGTDTDAFAYMGSGTAAALFSIPLKYMHTTVEMVHQDDLQANIDLMYETLLHLQPNTDFRYFS